jgi:hypothetical protein
MYVLTGKADGGTQDVLGFYHSKNQAEAWKEAIDFIDRHRHSRRCIIRLEVYNPKGKPPHPSPSPPGGEGGVRGKVAKELIPNGSSPSPAAVKALCTELKSAPKVA